MTKVMVVDDNPAALLTARDVLEEKGFETIEADSGEKCIEMLKTEKPDIILMDVMMPGMTGLETCKSIKKNKSTKDIPVIMVAAKCSEEDVLKGMRAGATDYFPKPFSFDALVAKVNSILKTKQTEEELELFARRMLDRETAILTLKEQVKKAKVRT